MEIRENVFDEALAWIGPRPEDRIVGKHNGASIETVYFTLDFTVAAEAEARANLRISAHSRYKLYINGAFVTFGPCKADDFQRYYEDLDVSGYLRKGLNSLVVKVVSYPPREGENGGHRGPHWSHNNSAGCCLFVAGTLVCGGESWALGTGIADWRYHVSDEMTPVKDTIASWLGYKEDVNGARYTQGPTGGAAQPAVKRYEANTNPYGEMPLFPLYRREIPLLYTIEKSFHATDIPESGTVVPPHSEKSFRLDAGEHTTAFPRIRLTGGSGATVTVRYAEAYFQKEQDHYIKKRRDDSTGVINGHADIYRPTSGEQMYEPFWFRTFRYIEITVETAENELCLQAPSYVETGYPLETVTAPGDSNEDWVRLIWDKSLRTLRRCMHETYEDCPYYEQLQYTMDTRLQMLFTYAVNGDTRLPRKTMHEYHTSRLPNGMLQSRYPCSAPQVIPVFALHWIFMLRDYYQQTGDKDFLRGYLGTVDQVLHYFRRCKKDGLVENLGYWEYVDWTPEWSDSHGVPHACQHGPSTTQNLQYLCALQTAAALVADFGFNDLAQTYQAEADALKQLLLDTCWNGTLFKEGPDIEFEYSQHAQLWAVLCGIGTQKWQAALLNAMLQNDRLIRCSFPTLFYMFRAFEQAGLYEQTEVLWEHWKALLPLGLTTIPEISFGDPRSDCHAWGSIMLYEFPRNILGVQARAPGFSEIVVEPKGFYIQKAEGTVFVPDGKIQLKRTVEAGTLCVEITPMCPQPVTLRLPDGTCHTVENHKTSVFTAAIG